MGRWRTWPELSSDERVARSRRAAGDLRAEIAGWLGTHRADQRFARFTGHFTALGGILARMLDAIEKNVAEIDVKRPSGQVYEQCRRAEIQLGLVRRTYEWYAEKYDQRMNDGVESVLRAADEVVRSCWVEAFAGIGRDAPTGPLVYLDSRFDAVATPRVSVPTDLRAPRDAVINEFLRELPIPTVALPATSAIEPWWLVLAAHETGHHVHYDLISDLVAQTRNVLETVARQSLSGNSDSATFWSAWALEVFADTFATLMVGPAAAWAVDELQHGTPGRLVTLPSPSQRYPPPVVRTALLGELARAIGADDPGPGATEVVHWLNDVSLSDTEGAVTEAVTTQLQLTPAVARAMVNMRVDGTPLRQICGWESRYFGEEGAVGRWTRALLVAAPVVTARQERAAARYGIAGGVAAFRLLTVSTRMTAGQETERMERLRVNLPKLLQTCGPPGTLAGKTPADITRIADRLTTRLLATLDD